MNAPETFHPSFRPPLIDACQCQACGVSIEFCTRVGDGATTARLETSTGDVVGIEEEGEIFCPTCYEAL